MNFIKAALFAILLVVLLLPVSAPSVVGWHGYTGAMRRMGMPRSILLTMPRAVASLAITPGVVPSVSTLCVTTCTPGSHCHNHQHCDSDGNCSNHCHRHVHHESPCTLWHWNIHGGLPDPGLGVH